VVVVVSVTVRNDVYRVKIVKNPGNRRLNNLNNLNDPVFNVLRKLP
jgi:hypothetical protein